VQTCGDAHISNFGGFAAADRRLVFGPNDFDETLPGPWEWDVKRMATSIEIAGRDIDLSDSARERILLRAIREYRHAMHDFAAKSHLDVWYERLSADQLFERFGTRTSAMDDHASLHRTFAKAKRKTSLRAVQKLTEVVDGQLRFRHVPPLLVPLSQLVDSDDAAEQSAFVSKLMARYAESLDDDRRHLLETYTFVDIARKVVGVGSVGTRAWVILLEGRGGQDPLVLQAKEAQASVLEPYVGASQYASHAERVVQGQRLMQAASDILLGWLNAPGVDGGYYDFYVRQLWDWKASADLSTMTKHGLLAYSRACAWSLARSHARSGDRLAIAAYLGKGTVFDRAIARYSRAYADQNERDFLHLKQAVADGRVDALSGV
jgi:uncharacterized protein (DUF2252 family)